MRDLRRAAEADPSYPAVLLVYQGDVEDGAAFFAKLWPEARAIADPEYRLYEAFGIERGGSEQFLTPGVVACGIRSMLKGNFVGRPQGGDARLMPGLFLVDGGRIVWRHDFRHAGDHPDFAAIPTHLPQPQAAAD